jgi:hypothetical protein
MAQRHRLVYCFSALAPSGMAERSMIELVVRGRERAWALFRVLRTKKNKYKCGRLGNNVSHIARR